MIDTCDKEIENHGGPHTWWTRCKLPKQHPRQLCSDSETEAQLAREIQARELESLV